MAEPIDDFTDFEESVLQRLERIAIALEKSTNIQREDFEFRRTQLESAAAEQKALVEKLTASVIPGAPAPQLEHGGSVFRRR